MTVPYTVRIKKQSDEVTSQAFHVFGIANELAIEISMQLERILNSIENI